MSAQHAGFRNFHIYAFLPFIQLAQESMIQMGPIVFWPASKMQEFLPEESIPLLTEYLKKVGQVKAHSCVKNDQFIDTVMLDPKQMMCVSISNEIPEDVHEFILIDAMYLLYFACSFRNLYYNHHIHSFNSFRKLVPASMDFINNKGNWESLHIKEVDREEIICLTLIDPEICKGLGRALETMYLPSNVDDPEFSQAYKRIVRAIRYLIDRFFLRFVNLFQNKGLHLTEELYEPENVIFLSSSFETLFNIEESQETAADFKNKLRPLLHLKYSRPVEIFWKWVDEFYLLKRKIMRGETFLDPMFRLNPNFEVSQVLLGIKLFVYSIYYYLFKYQLLQSTHVDPYTPPDFKWIHPEEILLFFWTEKSVLEKVSLFVKENEQGPLTDEALSEMNLLTTLFVSLYDRYYLSSHMKAGEGLILFLPTPVAELNGEGQYILQKIREFNMKDPQCQFLKYVHPYFLSALEDRLLEKRIATR